MKKLLSVLMIFVFAICSIVPVSTFAQEDFKCDCDAKYGPTMSCTVASGSLKEVSALAEVPACATIQEAANLLREGMKARTAVIEFIINVDNPADNWEKVYKEILDLAVAHTGVPDEGDYIYSALSHVAAEASWSGSRIRYSYTNTYKTTRGQEDAVDVKVDELVASLKLNSMNDYQKINTVYSYLCENIKYDYTSTSDLKYTAYAALINKTSVCQGYATLAYRLLLEVGVDTRLISGYSKGERHAWNIVNLHGLYYNIDATWDSNGNRRDYFLKSESDFANHDRNEEFMTAEFNEKYPMAAKSYVYNPVLDAPSIGVTLKPTENTNTVKPEVTPIAKPDVNTNAPYIYFTVGSETTDAVTMCVGDVLEFNVLFGGGDLYECYELLLGYRMTGSGCKIDCLSRDFGNGKEVNRITALEVGTTKFTRILSNRNNELLSEVTLTINVVDKIIATPTPTPTFTPTPTPIPTVQPTQTVEEAFIYFEKDSIAIHVGEKVTVNAYFGIPQGYSKSTSIAPHDLSVCTASSDVDFRAGTMAVEIEGKAKGNSFVIAECTGDGKMLDVAIIEVKVYDIGEEIPSDDGSEKPSIAFETDELVIREGTARNIRVSYNPAGKCIWYELATMRRVFENGVAYDNGNVEYGQLDCVIEIAGTKVGKTYMTMELFGPNGVYAVALLKINVCASDTLVGDVNGDAKINSRDIAQLQKHLVDIAEIKNAVVLFKADFNGDKKVNSRDIAAINKYIFSA
ncbi:MAG: hypothetical protein IJF80_02265 [Clostridia bacterium]|nr:hypothetical protein [Clostridia bacterium]